MSERLGWRGRGYEGSLGTVGHGSGTGSGPWDARGLACHFGAQEGDNRWQPIRIIEPLFSAYVLIMIKSASNREP